MKKSTFIIAYFLIIATLTLTLMPGKGHTCNNDDCPFKELNEFPEEGCGKCEPYSDCWLLDKMHFNNPNLDYDQNVLLLNKNLKIYQNGNFRKISYPDPAVDTEKWSSNKNM